MYELPLTPLMQSETENQCRLAVATS